MASTSPDDHHPARRKYSSPPHALVWSFRKSRDNWKRKYLDVKAQLKRARRRLDRLDQATLCLPAPAAASATPAVSCSAAPASVSAASALLGVLHNDLLGLGQQTQANRQLLENCQQQHRLLVDLAGQIQQCLGAAPPLEQPGSPTPVQTRQQPTQASTPQPSPKVHHQAPPQPKKGAPRHRER